MLNLSLTYRTASGQHVRGLNFQYQDQTVLIKGEVRKTGQRERVIIGECLFIPTSVLTTNKNLKEVINHRGWVPLVWTDDGRYTGNADLDLIEFKPEKVTTPKLF